jgi:hypothetical protein
MCAVDFQFHLGDDVDPARVYADEETLRAERGCVSECGIVEVEVSVVRWVQHSDYSSLIAPTLPPVDD